MYSCDIQPYSSSLQRQSVSFLISHRSRYVFMTSIDAHIWHRNCSEWSTLLVTIIYGLLGHAMPWLTFNLLCSSHLLLGFKVEHLFSLTMNYWPGVCRPSASMGICSHWSQMTGVSYSRRSQHLRLCTATGVYIHFCDWHVMDTCHRQRVWRADCTLIICKSAHNLESCAHVENLLYFFEILKIMLGNPWIAFGPSYL